jgi:hypothetical protein
MIAGRADPDPSGVQGICRPSGRRQGATGLDGSSGGYCPSIAQTGHFAGIVCFQVNRPRRSLTIVRPQLPVFFWVESGNDIHDLNSGGGCLWSEVVSDSENNDEGGGRSRRQTLLTSVLSETYW